MFLQIGAVQPWFLGMIFPHSTAQKTVLFRYLKLLVGRFPACMQPMAKIRCAGSTKLNMFLDSQKKPRIQKLPFFSHKPQGNKLGFRSFLDQDELMIHSLLMFFVFLGLRLQNTNIWHPELKIVGFWRKETLHPCTTPPSRSWAMASVLHNKWMKWRLKDGRRWTFLIGFWIFLFEGYTDFFLLDFSWVTQRYGFSRPVFLFGGLERYCIQNLVFEALASLARVFVPDLQGNRFRARNRWLLLALCPSKLEKRHLHW